MSEALTVLQTLPALHGGGVERGTIEVANALTAAGHRSLVVSGGGRLAAAAPGTVHIEWPIGVKRPWTLGLVPRLRRLLVEEAVDILHARSRLPAWIAYLAWRGLPAASRPSFVTTAHGFYSVSWYSAVMTRGERVIAVSGAVRDFLLASFPALSPARVVVIPRGVDPDRYRPGYRPDAVWCEGFEAELGLAGERLVTLPGRLTRLKGHLAFVELIGRLRRRGMPVRGLIVGGEDPRRRRYARQVAARIESSGLRGQVTMLGHREDLREILARSDLVVSPSGQPESFGRVVLESLALGRPVVGYAHGGVAEILAALLPGGAVRPGDEEQLAEAAERFLHAPPDVAPATAFGLARMLDSTLGLYRELAGRSD